MRELGEDQKTLVVPHDSRRQGWIWQRNRRTQKSPESVAVGVQATKVRVERGLVVDLCMSREKKTEGTFVTTPW